MAHAHIPDVLSSVAGYRDCHPSRYPSMRHTKGNRASMSIKQVLRASVELQGGLSSLVSSRACFRLYHEVPSQAAA